MPTFSANKLTAALVFLALSIWLATLAPSAEIAWVLGLLLLTVYLFAFEVLRVDVAAVTLLLLLGLLSSAHELIGLARPLVPAGELFQGFASNAVVSIIGVMIIGAGLDKTGLMTRLAGVILKLAGQTEARVIPAVSGTVGRPPASCRTSAPPRFSCRWWAASPPAPASRCRGCSCPWASAPSWAGLLPWWGPAR
ncbi:MAG: SLC13 family permease [Thiobacillaceae bacterium]